MSSNISVAASSAQVDGVNSGMSPEHFTKLAEEFFLELKRADDDVVNDVRGVLPGFKVNEQVRVKARAAYKKLTEDYDLKGAYCLLHAAIEHYNNSRAGYIRRDLGPSLEDDFMEIVKLRNVQPDEVEPVRKALDELRSHVGDAKNFFDLKQAAVLAWAVEDAIVAARKQYKERMQNRERERNLVARKKADQKADEDRARAEAMRLDRLKLAGTKLADLVKSI